MVLVSSLAVDWPFGVGLRLYIGFAQAVDYDVGMDQYEQENCSMNLKCRLYRNKWVQSITVSDVMESGQVVENPMIGAIPSRNEVQRELDDLLMSM